MEAFPALGVNWLDFVVVVLLIIFAWQGLERGLGDVWSELLGFFGGWIAAHVLTPLVAPQMYWFQVTFDAVFVVVYVIFLASFSFLVTKAVKWSIIWMPRQYFSKRWHLLFGVTPSLLLGILISSLVLLGLSHFYPWKEMADSVKQSMSYTMLDRVISIFE